MLVEAVDEGAHAVIPELDHAAVKTREDPWALAVKAQSLHSIALSLEFRQHFRKNPLSTYDRKWRDLRSVAEFQTLIEI